MNFWNQFNFILPLFVDFVKRATSTPWIDSPCDFSTDT